MLVKKCLLAIAIFISLHSISQTVQLSGTVTGNDKSPISGVTVQLKKSKKIVKTDAEGKFIIRLPKFEADSLILSSIGYETVMKYVETADPLTITMKENATGMNDIVVVGYGTQKKKDVTGAVVSLSKDRLETLPNNTFAQALQGSVAGVNITTTGGNAEGNNASIRIRGTGSITASNSPLIVVDGTPFTGGLSDVNPNDIETIDVLKDASSIAIYGARGANGVIMITTKQGKRGKMVIKYDGTFGIEKISNKPDLMNGSQFYKFKYDRLIQDSINAVLAGSTGKSPDSVITFNEQNNYKNHLSTDWVDLATREGSRVQHTLSISGTTDKTKYYFSGSMLKANGVAKNDQFTRYTLRSNLEYKLYNWCTINSNTQLSLSNRDGIAADFSGTGTGAVYLSPLTAPYDSTGNLTMYPWDPYNKTSPVEKIANPLSNLLVKNEDNQYRMISNNSVKVDFPFLKGLSYKLSTGVELEYNLRNTYYGVNTTIGFTNSGEAINYNNLQRHFLVDNILTFNREYGKHSVGVTAVYSMESSDFNSDSYTGIGFPSDVLTNYQMSSATKITQTTTYWKANNLAQLIRLNYGYEGKYLLTFSTRRDGFSGFGNDVKYGIFPSGAFGWNIMRENFFKNFKYAKNISNLKLRTSYGLTGNQAVSPYSSLANFKDRTYLTAVYDSITGTTSEVIKNGVLASKLSNPDLSWESQKEFDLGIDVGVLKNRINFTFDYYFKNNYNLLLNRTLSPVMGIPSITQNIGETENMGFEISISSINITKKDFEWSSQINYSNNANKLTKLYVNSDSDKVNQWIVGQPININYDFVYDGVWQTGNVPVGASVKPGYAKVRGFSGIGNVPPSLKDVIGHTDPTYTWGFSNTFKYKGITLYVFLQGVGGNTKLDNLQSDNIGSQITNNVINRNWWTSTNPTNEHWANNSNANPSGVKIYEDASFVRLKDITLSYDFPAKFISKAKLNTFKVYVTARNLVTFTKYKGVDPELANYNNSAVQWGMPLQKSYTLGVSLTF